MNMSHTVQIRYLAFKNADITQLGEYLPYKQEANRSCRFKSCYLHYQTLNKENKIMRERFSIGEVSDFTEDSKLIW